jgi:hypothetical protein
METEHTETVVDKAVAYVKDFFGVPPGDRTPDVEANPEYTDTAPEPTIEGAMRLEPHTRTLKIGSEINAEKREDESANSAVDAHTHAAEQIDHAKGLVGQALGEIDDISRGMREKIVDEKNPSYKDAERGGKEMPSESEMQEAVERASAADIKERSRLSNFTLNPIP